MGILQRLTGRTAAVSPRPAALPAATPPLTWQRSTTLRAPGQTRDREVVHTAAGPAVVVAGHWWTTTPRLVCRGTTYVAGAQQRAPAVTEAQRRYGSVVLAQLVADPGNPHHAGAVAVWVGDLHVGYVRRDVLSDSGVRTLRRLLDREPPVTVWARIERVVNDAGDYLGVTLLHALVVGVSQAWPFPVAFPPVAYAKVLGEPAAQAALLLRLSSSSETERSNPERPQLIVPATVSIAGDGGATRVQVSVDGEPVGALSAAASATRAEVVQQVLATGRAPIAQLRLRSNAEHSKLTASLLCPEHP